MTVFLFLLLFLDHSVQMQSKTDGYTSFNYRDFIVNNRKKIF